MDSLEQTLATVHDLLRAERLDEAAALLRRCPVSAEQVGYDNWNGGTDIYEVRLELPPSEFARLGTRRSQLEEQIAARLKTVLEPETQDWYSVRFVPAKTTRPDWRSDGQADAPQKEIALPRQVRQNIVDGLKLEKVVWFGTLDDVEFLSRLYDLKGMPSKDSRYKDAAGDIWQHRFNNDDWENDWVYSDDRFKLLDGSAEAFLRFLCEIVHPVVRPIRDEAIKLVSHFNDQLRQAGWEIFEEEFIAGRPRFSYRPLRNQTARAVMRARTVADALDAGWMAKEIERLEQAVDRDPALAIGTAKELVESCCKSLLSKRSVPFTKSEDLGELTKKVTKELHLVPEGITDETKGADNIRLILRNLTQLTNNLAQLRGLYGTGHGRDGQHRGLQPRHARLIDPSSPMNPWSTPFVRARNRMIVIILLAGGMRKGEMLGLKVQDLLAHNAKLQILRRADDPEDSRTYQPNTKTADREVPLGPKICRALEEFIRNERRSIKAARRIPQIFTSDEGDALSLSSANQIFVAIRRACPELPRDLTAHVLRHTWNDRFTEHADKTGMAPVEEERARAEHQGWVDGSPMVATYTRRHTERKGRAVALSIQEKLEKRLDGPS